MSEHTIGGRRNVSLFHSDNISGYDMLSFGVWWSRVPCASPLGSPDRGTRRHSTRMYHIQNSAPPTFHPDVSHSESSPPTFHSNILHPAPDAGWERRAFQLPRSDISGSSDSAYPESFAAILHSAAVFSWSFPICPTDILRYFYAQCRGVLLKLPDICDRHFEIFCFRYFACSQTHPLYSFARK